MHKKNPYLNQAAQKILANIFLPQKIPKSKISNPLKSFDHPCHVRSRVRRRRPEPNPRPLPLILWELKLQIVL